MTIPKSPPCCITNNWMTITMLTWRGPNPHLPVYFNCLQTAIQNFPTICILGHLSVQCDTLIYVHPTGSVPCNLAGILHTPTKYELITMSPLKVLNHGGPISIPFILTQCLGHSKSRKSLHTVSQLPSMNFVGTHTDTYVSVQHWNLWCHEPSISSLAQSCANTHIAWIHAANNN